MKYSEFLNELENNGRILIVRVSSGHSFCGELASATHFGPRYVKLKTKSGTRVRVNNACGRCEVAGKHKECFVVGVDRMNDQNFFPNTIN